MLSFYEQAKQLIDTSTGVTENVNQELARIFNLRADEVSRRFKSFFGMTIREALEEKHLPSRSDIENALLLADNVGEMQAILKLNPTSSYWKGLLDREFGYSTFASAKANFLSSKLVANYNPTKDDNMAILISQRLGDGSVDKVRNILRIDHGINQFDYLRFKVSLLNKAYPESNPVSHIKRRMHKQGHEYVSYYSGQFSKSSILKLINMTDEELIDGLTPLGWLLWYLDDGHYSASESGCQSLGFCIHSEKLKMLAADKLLSYGFKFNVTKECIVLQSKPEIARYINGMLKPFKHIVPQCMHYKIEMKI